MMGKRAADGGRATAAMMVALLVAIIAGFSGCGGSGGGGSTTASNPTPAPTPALPQACSGQSLVGIDPVNNIGYVSIYALDGAGNGQLALVDLTIGAANPVLQAISLTGSIEPLAVVYNPASQTMLAAAADADGNVNVYVIPTASRAVASVVAATGLAYTGSSGGIIEDVATNNAYVAGTNSFGVLDTSKNPPVWHPETVITLSINTDSYTINSTTGWLFVSNAGANSIVDTTKAPFTEIGFVGDQNEQGANGTAFDVHTNVVIQSENDRADAAYAYNFTTLDLTPTPAEADYVLIPGLGTLPPVGNGPGGMLTINCTTHQAIIADDFGQNFKLMQMPKVPPPGPLDNNGQPGSGTHADAASIYTIAAAIIPKGIVNGTPTQLGAFDYPSSLAVDPARNLAYMLADTNPNPHIWTPGDPTPLFLVREDLSNPVFGASPTGGVDGKTFWNPTGAAIPMP